MSMEEVWKDIEGYEGKYQVSNLGRVRSLDRQELVMCHGVLATMSLKGKVLKPSIICGYYHVALLDHQRRKTTKVHRLVAKAFVPGYFEGAEVNHIDENKLNNVPSNLEWCTRRYNHMYGTRTERATAHCRAIRRGVVQMDLDGNDIQPFNSIRHAEKVTGIPCASIYNACVGKAKTAKGYRWRYAQ